MDLSQVENHELLNRLEKLSRSERKITHLILWHILELENRRLYADRGFSSCFEYLTQGLGYSEGSANRRLQSARLLKQVPEAAQKIENGSLKLSQLAQVQKCLRHEKQNGKPLTIERTQEILSLVESKNTFETEKVLAKEFNRTIEIREKLQPQKDHSVKLELTLTAEQMQELELAKSLLSHVCVQGTWAEVISYLAKNHNKKPKSTARSYLPVKLRRELFNKAKHCCEYLDPKTHRKCTSKYQLQIDHIAPVAHGGDDQNTNLRILCRTHNIHAAKVLGLTFKR
ncbi:MAG: HNH endonuclease signature motif containing protein [Bdellovibrionota bacterium]